MIKGEQKEGGREKRRTGDKNEFLNIIFKKKCKEWSA